MAQPTLFLDYRIEKDLGSVAPTPQIYEAEWVKGKVVAGSNLNGVAAAGLHVLFATHGFNVDRVEGVGSLAALRQALALGPDYLFIGVLWPGNWHLPVINYPKEGDDASECGKRLATFARTGLAGAKSIRFLSHSLGGRVVLEAVKGLRDDERRIPQICLAAPAIDRRCLSPGNVYDRARTKAGWTTVMASKDDEALGAVYSAGSWAAAILGDNHPYGVALGRDGPNPDSLSRVETLRFPGNRHGDYFPGGGAALSARETASVKAMVAALTREPPPA